MNNNPKTDAQKGFHIWYCDSLYSSCLWETEATFYMFQVDGEEDASCSLILLYALFINLFFKKGGQISPLTVYINENPPQVPLGITRT